MSEDNKRELAAKADPDLRLAETEGSLSDEARQAARDMMLDRFRLQDMQDGHIKALFELAVDRQARMMLNRPVKTPAGGNPPPDVRPHRPAQVKMRALLDSSRSMGTLPAVFHRLTEIINDPAASATRISRVVAMDPSLAARLLRLVNSPFYGFAARVDSIPRAVALVGTSQLTTLAMGSTLISIFKGVPVSLVNMQSFWAHSISCGVAARLIARRRAMPSAEGAFVSGLLHDISRLLIYSLLPEHARLLLEEARQRQLPVHRLEKEILGFGHEDLGAELLNMWNCPADLVQSILLHHAPLWEDSSAENLILYTANALVQALGHGSSGEIYIPPLSPLAWERLGLSPEELLEQCRLLDDKVRELRSLFAPA